MLESLHLENDAAVYTYTKEGAAATVSLSLSLKSNANLTFSLPFLNSNDGL